MGDVDALAAHLVASDRWTDESAVRLVQDLLDCGPVASLV